MATLSYKARFKYSTKKFLNLLKTFMHNKRAALGTLIIIVFSILALSSQFLTPYDPVLDERLAGTYATPFWFRNLPGGESLSENLVLLERPGFSTPVLLAEWNFTSTGSDEISVSYDSMNGSEAPGCISIVYNRRGERPIEMPRLYITKGFYYPHNGAPERFKCQLAVLAKAKQVNVQMLVTLERVNGTVYDLWSNKFLSNANSWYKPAGIDSYALRSRFERQHNSTDVSKTVFPSPANYLLSIETKFIDTQAEAEEAVATVLIDDFNLRLFGTAFGLLGTDHKGRDLFTQLAYGSRISLFVGLLSAIVGVVIGLTVGLIAGYMTGFVDEVLMRFTDMMLVLPGLPLLLVLTAALGASIWNIVLLIGVLGWMGFARVVRSQVLTLKERPYVEAAKAVGAGKFYIIGRHIIPNVMSLVYVSLALSVPSAIIAEAALSWLGLFDPTVMSWGRMLRDVQASGAIHVWWWVIPPGLSIALVSLSFILIGYALDELLNPKLRERR